MIVRSHDDGNCSITGGVVVRDRALAGLRGRYVFGDFCKGRVESARLSAGRARGVRRTSLKVAVAVVVRRGRAGPRVRALARRAGLPDRAALSAMEVLLVRAANPSPFTLDGTNTWVVGRDPAWVVDPGPALPDHLDAVAAAVAARGGAGGIALTHDHADHAEGLPALRERLGDPPVGRMPPLRDGDTFGPFTALHVPGHAPDHLVFVAGGAAFTGDAVLGAGSVFIAPGGGGLGAYLDGLRRLRALGLRAHPPGHGPEVDGPGREARRVHRPPARARAPDRRGARRRRCAARTSWSPPRGTTCPRRLRLPARWTLQAHLEKLRAEGRLPVRAGPRRSAVRGTAGRRS